MPRPERPLDDTDEPVVAFAAALRRLREKAGNPAYRSLARRAKFSAATLATAASGRRLPTLPVTLAYVEACGGDRQEWDERWRAVAAGISPGPPEGAGDRDAGPPVGTRSPYVGLAAFEPDDAELFYGRDGLVEDLLGRLARRRLIVVFGPSGVGKSSVVRAGLMPAVRAGAWSGPERIPDRGGVAPAIGPVALIVPGSRPLTEIAVRFAVLARVPAGVLLDDLSADPGHAGLVVRQALCDEPEGSELLLVVDQFERVFSADVDSAERAAFVAVLVALCQSPDSRARVVIAARADHYPRFVEYPDLLAAMADGQVLVGGMSPAELREAVVKPAERVGARVEGALVSAVVAEVAGRPGALPLASHALLEAWRRRRGTTVTLAGYEAAGGVDGAVASTAERVYRAFDDEQRRVARRLLLRMVDVDQSGVVQRRQVPRSELTSAGQETMVVDRLADARLLTTDHDRVEMAHEALIRAWPRLREWVEEDSAGLRIHRRLTDAAAGWESLGRDEGALYRGARLAAATEWADRDRAALTPLEREFVTASVDLRRREVAAVRRRRRVAWTSAALVSVLLAVLSVVALQQAGRATAERDRAFARQLTANARAQRHNDPELALMLAMRAYETWLSAETDAVLRQATADARFTTTYRGHLAPVHRIAVSPDGRRIASSDDRSTVHVWDPAGRMPPTSRSFEYVSAIEFSPDGARLAITEELDGGTGRVTVWPVDSSRATTYAYQEPAFANDVAFSPDGRSVAVGGPGASPADGEASAVTRVVDATTGRVSAVLRQHTPRREGFAGLAFARNGEQLATAVGGTVTQWDLDRPARPLHTATAGTIFASTLTADGTRIAATDGARVWTAATTDMTERVMLRGGESATHLALSRDGQRIAAAHDRTIDVWHLANPFDSVTLYSPGPVSDLAFSPDGTRLVTGGTDATVRVWDVDAGLPPVITVPDATVPVVMNANGSAVAAAAAGGTVRVRQPDGGTVVLRGAPAGASRLEMSDNGRVVAAHPFESRDVSVWNLDGVGPPRVLRSVCPASSQAIGEIELSPDGRWAVAHCADDRLRVWDVTGARSRPILLPRSTRPFAFSPDAQLLAASTGVEGLPRGVTVWRLPDASATFTATAPETVTHVTFGPDSRLLAVQTRDGSTRIHRSTSGGNAPTVLAGEPSSAGEMADPHIAFSPDGRLVAQPTSEGAIRIQNVDGTGEPIVLDHFGPGIISLEFAPGGRDLVTLHLDVTVRRLPCAVCGAIATVTALARQRITRDFTAEERQKYLPGTS